MMNFSMKTLRLGLALATLYNTQALVADTVYFHFKHIPVKSREFSPKAGTLIINLWIPAHHAQSRPLALNEFDQDHMKGISGTHNALELTLTCFKDREEIRSPSAFMLLIIDETTPLKEIDISASCPLDERGNVLIPTNLTIVRKH